ncbi:MAG: Trypsin-like peptidase domain [Bradyrhizobium sp.]|jgi:hypothetical protein|nr:Trypsin-like peptidase domain [Bradyrhizobium sp.]
MIHRTIALVMLVGTLIVSPAAAQSFTRAIELARTYTVAVRVTGTAVDGQPDIRYGSGAILRGNGFVGTAGHVIGAASEWLQGSDGDLKRTIQVRIPDAHGYLEDQWRPAELFKPGPSDVAVIKVIGADFKHADCRILQEVRGTDIYRLGFVEGGQGGWADEKGGKTAVSGLPQNFQGSMISQKGMSGGPAIDATGRVLGLSVNRENDPRFPSQSFTEFVRIEELAALLPQSDNAGGCQVTSSGSDVDVVDLTPRLKSLGGEATVIFNYPDQAVTIRPGEYVLGGRSLRLKAKKLVLDGSVVIRSFAADLVIPEGQQGVVGAPGKQSGGDGQNGARGLQGEPGGPGGEGRSGRASGAYLIELEGLALKADATLQIVAGGEPGGKGGRGGVGGPGGPGGAGRNRGGNMVCGGAVSPGNGGPGGKGGVGGPGGKGGRGGEGGQIAYAAALADYLVDRKLILAAPGGIGGPGGGAGPGGSSGPGGAAGGSSHCGGGGDPGAAGAVGDGGNEGAVGIPGSYGDVRGL